MLTLKIIQSRLQNYSPRTLPDDGSLQGAVMVPIYRKDTELYILFTKRTENLSTHKGQISFPGGKRDDCDKTLYDCALRETWEEIGIKKGKVTLYGSLDQIKTGGSNILLTPFVCKIDYPFTLKINEAEVEEIIEVPLQEIFKQENWDIKKVMMAEVHEIHIYYFQYKKWVIWGATGKILHHLKKLLR